MRQGALVPRVLEPGLGRAAGLVGGAAPRLGLPGSGGSFGGGMCAGAVWLVQAAGELWMKTEGRWMAVAEEQPWFR